MYIVNFRTAVLCRSGDPVIQRHRGGVFIYLRKPRSRFVIDLRIQVIPGKLFHTVMDIHVSQRSLCIRRIVRLNRRSDSIKVCLVDALVPEARRKVQVIRSVQTIRQQYVSIVIDISAAGGNLQFQDILPVHVHSVAQRQCRGDVIPVLFQAHDLRILQGLCAVDRDYLIRDRIHGRTECLYADLDLSLLTERSDRISHLAYIHLMVIAMQAVEIDPVLLHIDERECR